MYIVRPNLLMKKLYPSAIWRIPDKEKKLYFTFDDGPVPEVTPQVLSILRDYKAKATFFCVGENIEKHPDVFRQIVSEGHSIGNHTYNHLNGWKTKTKKYLENIKQCDLVIGNQLPVKQSALLTTYRLPLFRPPYGKMTFAQYSILNIKYSIVMWDVLSGDFDENTSKEKCLKNVLTKTRNGSIIVFHDSEKAKEKLFYVLPKILEYFSNEKYEFCAFDFYPVV
ncbi:MAG: polysaccharide deacetylase family protein [Bacteroidota bacterium]